MVYPTLYFVPGDDWEQELLLQDETGAAIDYSGWTVQSAAIVWTKSELAATAVAVDISAAGDGRLVLAMPDTATDDPLTAFGGDLTIKLVDGAGIEKTVYYALMRAQKTLSGRTAVALQPGTQGPVGINWRGDWATETAYAIRDGIYEDGTSYRCIAAHTAGASTRPSSGASWADYWAIVALGSDVDSVAAVAAIAVEIEAVAAISNEVQTVAGIAGQVQTVAARDTDIGTVAARDTEIATVAARDTDIGTVAARDVDIGTVAARDANIGTAADNIDAIIAAPTEAAAAAVSEANALTYAGQADASRILAETALTGAESAEAGADQAYADTLVALTNVTDYEETLGLLNGAAKEIVAATDVVAVFIYDTRKDSDGGAWRKRCRHASWYNETLNTATRGSRREFPQQALVVARHTTSGASVTIYDLDSPSCPMWMVFTASWSIGSGTMLALTASPAVISSVSMLNGILLVGSTQASTVSGLHWVDFLTERAQIRGSSYRTYTRHPNIAARNTTVGFDSSVADLPAIVSGRVNAAAATVLPGTPIDPVRGLPNPTVAAGTDGGTSVIHWDGRVTSSANASPVANVAFGSDGTLYWTQPSLLFSPSREYATTSFTTRYYASTGSVPAVQAAGGPVKLFADKDVFVGSGLGLNILKPEPASGFSTNLQNNRSAVAYITNAFNTGHMVGDIKMALAESTADVTSLVEATPLNDDFSSYANDAALQAAWQQDANALITLSSGTMRVENGSATNASAWRSFTTVIGRRYRFLVDNPGAANLQVRISNTVGTGSLATVTVNSGTVGAVVSFVATATTTWIGIRTMSATLGAFVQADNIRGDLVAEDRSVAANHPIVKGTVTRAAVASGAELVAYGGFSASNYLELPYSSALDFGTGDFCVMGWFRSTATAYHPIALYNVGDTANSGWGFRYSQWASRWEFKLGATGEHLVADAVPASGQWCFFTALRRSGAWSLFRDGLLLASGSNSQNVSLTNATVRIGDSGNYPSFAGSGNFLRGNLALLRLGATAPTPAQIRAIYEAARHLFQANAKCLLPGAAVSALAYDDSTDLLHVATTAGSARMRGIAVVEKDATVYTGIDAKAGIVATRDSGSADIFLPSVPLREAALMGHNGGPPLYDRRTSRHGGVTTNATPTVIARLPMDKGEFGEWVIRTVAREYDSGAELAAYEDVLLARRPGEGNIAISGSVTQRVIQEVTSSMAVAITANTTTQTIDVTATGVASKNIEWTVEARMA